MQKAYKFSILYFLAFGILLLASSVALFSHKLGFSLHAIASYYLGDEQRFIPAKTYLGTLKIILPHILGFGIFVMVTLHFFLFTRYKNTKLLSFITYGTFFVAFTELFTPFMILQGFESFAVLKLLSFVLFEGIILLLIALLTHNILSEKL